MADDKGKPIVVELAPSPPAHAPTDPDRPANCVACGHYHGSLGIGQKCLEAEVRRLRILLADFPAVAAELRRYRAGVARAHALGATAAGLDLLTELVKGGPS
jgi:hypothetical protein